MGYIDELVVEKGDVIDIRLTTKVLYLALYTDLFLKIKDIVGIGMDSNNSGDTAGTDSNAEDAARYLFLIGCSSSFRMRSWSSSRSRC